MSTMFGYLSEVFSEELSLPRAKLEFKKEHFTLKETVMSCLKVFQFKKNSFDLIKSSVMFLPMTDRNPSDVTCVSSTLHYVSEHAKQHGIANPIVTFDQSLWLKAFNIIQTEPANSELRKVIVLLGAFHAEMSFLGSIGHLMAGSGLREVLELIYAPNAVDHIMTGKAIARAVRANLIVDAALNALLYSEALEVPVPRPQHTGIMFHGVAIIYFCPLSVSGLFFNFLNFLLLLYHSFCGYHTDRDENGEDEAIVCRDAETEQRGIVLFQNNMIHLYMSLKADNNHMSLFYIL